MFCYYEYCLESTDECRILDNTISTRIGRDAINSNCLPLGANGANECADLHCLDIAGAC